MEKKTLGAFLAVLRKSKGYTQKQLAEQLGVSDKTVSHWERDESAPDISVLPVLADIFCVTVDELLRGEKNTAGEPAQNSGLSPKSETQLRYLLEKNFHKFKNGFWAAMCIAVLGLLLSYVLYDRFAVSVQVLSLLFLFAAAAVLLFFAGSFSFSLKSDAFPKELLLLFRRRCKRFVQLGLLLLASPASFMVCSLLAVVFPLSKAGFCIAAAALAAGAVLVLKNKRDFFG
ncbi:MAG: helix-turn-helix transcriptional regulator [Clostridia bacterium]|nr:helix-turn-helix transcriptional regulator [Clostridia bacterium]